MRQELLPFPDQIRELIERYKNVKLFLNTIILKSAQREEFRSQQNSQSICKTFILLSNAVLTLSF